MNSFISSTLIVTTYNWPEALRLVLKSVRRQSLRPDQIVIADDGSGSDTASVVKEQLKAAGLRYYHVWHEDKGVRQSRIKNLAVKYVDSPYLIFIDHDVVLHPDFIKDHVSMARQNYFLQGKRVILPEHYTQNILRNRSFKPPAIFLKKLGNRKNTIRSPLLGKLFARGKKFETSLRGCNLSMFRSDFIKVDGFDEAFDKSWGREDSDICYRLFHSGIKVRNLWFLALQYHLKHSVDPNWDRERLDKELQNNVLEKRIKARIGFSQLSAEGSVLDGTNHTFQDINLSH